METLWQDLKFGARMLRKNASFTLVAVLTLALGIGVNTTVFSFYNAIALRPLPVRDPERIVRVFRTAAGERPYSVASYPDYSDYRDHNTAFSGLIAFAQTPLQFGGLADQPAGGGAERIRGMLVSGNYFSELGAAAAFGRTFAPEEDQTPGTHPVVVLSHDFWERRFGADPNAIGRRVVLNNLAYTVIGVAPKGFLGLVVEPCDAWVPLMMTPNVRPGTDLLHSRESRWLWLFGRLKPDVSPQRAAAELTALARQIDEQSAQKQEDVRVLVTPGAFLTPMQKNEINMAAFLLLAAVGLVLVVACANVANLLLARASNRQKEMAMRLALGASRGRLVRQILTENLLLFLLGGAGAVLLATWVADVLVATIHPVGERALSLNVTPDIRVFGYTLVISLLAGLAFGLLPALQTTRRELTVSLKDDAGSVGMHLSRGRIRNILMVGQVAAALVLLIAGGLLVRALGKAQRVDPGFEMKSVAVLSMDLRMKGYDDSRAAALQAQLTERLAALPGVHEIGMGRGVPLSSAFYMTSFVPEGMNLPPNVPLPDVDTNIVSPEFFSVLRIPLLAGRNFARTDSQQAVASAAIVNEALARRFWPGENPLGKRFRTGRSGPYTEVVGVVKNTRSIYLWAADEPALYLPVTTQDHLEMRFFVRTGADPQQLVASMVGLVKSVDPAVDVRAQTLAENLALWLWPSQMGALLSSVLGSLALVLAAVGIYGLLSYLVSQRTREIGIRVALGAQKRDVLFLVLGQGIKVVLIGLAIGLVISIGASRLLARFLYGLSAVDAIAFIGVSLFLFVVALVACYVPARRATRVDPMVALRYE